MAVPSIWFFEYSLHLLSLLHPTVNETLPLTFRDQD